jgi:hypothetical protein
MIKREDLKGKAVKFVASDGFAVNCFDNGDICEDVNNYYCIPNFHNMDATGMYAKDEYTMEVVG